MENSPIIDETQKYCIVDVSLDMNTHIGVYDISIDEASQWISDNQTQLDIPIEINGTVFEGRFIYKFYPIVH